MTFLEKLKSNDFEKFSKESLITVVKMCRTLLEQRDILIEKMEEHISLLKTKSVLTNQMVLLGNQGFVREKRPLNSF